MKNHNYNVLLVIVFLLFLNSCATRPPTPGELETKEIITDLVTITQKALNQVEAYLISSESNMAAKQADLSLKSSVVTTDGVEGGIVIFTGKYKKNDKNHDAINLTLIPGKTDVQKLIDEDKVVMVDFGLKPKDGKKLTTDQRLAGMVIAALQGITDADTKLRPSDVNVLLGFEISVTSGIGASFEFSIFKLGGLSTEKSSSSAHHLKLTFKSKPASPPKCAYTICLDEDCAQSYCVKNGDGKRVN